MPLMSRLPTRHYFHSMFVVVATLFIVFSTVIYRNYSDAQRLNDWTLYNYEIVRRTRVILLDLVDMETGVRGYALSGDSRFLEPYDVAQKKLDPEIDNLVSYTKNDADAQKNIAPWRSRIDDFSTLLKAQVRTVQSQGNKGFARSDVEKQKQKMDALRDLFSTYLDQRLHSLKSEIEQSRMHSSNFQYTLVFGTVLAVGGMLFVTGIITSLIGRNQRAERKTRDTENRFLTVLNGVNDGLFDFNFEDKTIYYSQAYKQMLGYSDDEYPNELDMFTQHIHPDDLTEALETSRQYRNGELSEYSSVFRMRHKDGRWIWVLSRGVGLRDTTGKMIRLIGTHTDITEQKKREELLEQLNREMETFTYITSHDLRAPLVNLKGFAKEMQSAVDRVTPILQRIAPTLPVEEQAILTQALVEDIPESVRFITRSVEKMDALTTAVLDLSRIGKREYRLTMVDTNALMSRCLDTLRYELNQKEIEVVCEPLPAILSDALALEQIFSNILDNAVKYLDPNRKGKIVISCTQAVGEAIFSITDNGRGVSDADKEKVFQFFRRARNATDVRGLGMGMSFVQATLRRLGGEIWFESMLGKGTTFHFRLPKRIPMKGLPL